jgi:two-component system, NtrC family, response regulator AtoC
MIETVIARILLGESLSIQRVRSLIARIATSDLPVLVQGETGTGKELVAQALHIASGRPGAFVALNACAIAETVFEDALFGHVRGAFTGAVADNIGYLAEADRGTVFLDEISALPAPAQAKLLRALETKQFRPLGARCDRASDFRIVAATNVPLDDLIATGDFRRDLARRLRAVTIAMPPLADRLSDVPILVQHFVASVVMRAGAAASIDADAMQLLQSHSWPDNVRELRQVVECALALGPDRSRLDRRAVGAALELVCCNPPRGRARDNEERSRLIQTLEMCGWRIGDAAAQLGVHRTTLFRRMRRLEITVPHARRSIHAPLGLSVAEPYRADLSPDRPMVRPPAGDADERASVVR